MRKQEICRLQREEICVLRERLGEKERLIAGRRRIIRKYAEVVPEFAEMLYADKQREQGRKLSGAEFWGQKETLNRTTFATIASKGLWVTKYRAYPRSHSHSVPDITEFPFRPKPRY